MGRRRGHVRGVRKGNEDQPEASRKHERAPVPDLSASKEVIGESAEGVLKIARAFLERAEGRGFFMTPNQMHNLGGRLLEYGVTIRKELKKW